MTSQCPFPRVITHWIYRIIIQSQMCWDLYLGSNVRVNVYIQLFSIKTHHGLGLRISFTTYIDACVAQITLTKWPNDFFVCHSAQKNTINMCVVAAEAASV